jgi:hypothetical protein
MHEMKTFFGGTPEAAQKAAREWVAHNPHVFLTLHSVVRQSASGGWMVTIYFQKRPAPRDAAPAKSR